MLSCWAAVCNGGQADVCTSRQRDELLISLHALMRKQEREAVASAAPASTRRDFGSMPVVALCD